MTELVQFEVYTDTKLLWDVRYDNASSEHVLTGRLLMSDGTVVPNQSVVLFLNDTQVTTLTTNSSGLIEYRRHFDPGNESDNSIGAERGFGLCGVRFSVGVIYYWRRELWFAFKEVSE